MGKTIDMTKVNLEAKSILFLTLAFIVVIVTYGVAQVGAAKVTDMLKGATSGAADVAEEF